MAAKKTKSAAPRRAACYKVEGEKATLARKYCSRCGPGFIMADHKDRLACGKCGYTEFKK
jgi:small subunit ribosomal protein S27Ae